MTNVVMAWAEYHSILAPSAILIALGVIGGGALLVSPFKKEISEKKILDEKPWKDPHEEQ